MTSRFGTLISMLLVAFAAFGLYQVKYRVQAIQAEIVEVSKTLDEERESLNVAAAEWAYLTQPERLQRLSEKYLRMQPVKTSQVADLKDLGRFSPAASADERVLPASLTHPPAGGE